MRHSSPLDVLLGALFVLAFLFGPTSSASAKGVKHDATKAAAPEDDKEHALPTDDAVEQHASAPGHGGSEPVFVTPPEMPTKVRIGTYLISLVEVSAPNESFPTFKAEVYIDLEWHDPRLAFDEDEVGSDREVFLEHEAELELERIWWPDIEFENEQGERHTESRELVITSDGTVEYSERFQGVFTVDVNLTRFPFDHQKLLINVESFSWDDRAVVFEPLLEKTGYDKSFKTLEWTLRDVHTEVHLKKEVRSTEAFSEYVFSVNADRDPGYYLYKIVAPLLIIVAFSYTTFWMPGEPGSTRMQRGIIMLLTIVAFHRVISANLPRIGYLTFMDGVVYVSYLLVGLTLLSNVMAQRFQYSKRPELVEKMDAIGRFAFPVIFIGSLVILWIIYHSPPPELTTA